MHDGLPFSKPKVRLLGSPGEAQAYLGEAYNLLYKVRAFCEASGTPVFAMSRSMPDGAIVTAAVVGDEHIVSCTPPAPQSQVEREKPELAANTLGGFILRPAAGDELLGDFRSWPDVFLATAEYGPQYSGRAFRLALEGLPKTPQIQIETRREAGPVSWRGLRKTDNGDTLEVYVSWNHGLPCRYRLSPDLDCSGRNTSMVDFTAANNGEKGVYLWGRKYDTPYGVVGACVFGNALLYVAHIDTEFVPDGDPESPENKVARMNSNARTATFFIRDGDEWKRIARVRSPNDLPYLAPWFFSPSGDKCGTVLDDSGHNIIFEVSLAEDGAGGFSVSTSSEYVESRAAYGLLPYTAVEAHEPKLGGHGPRGEYEVWDVSEFKVWHPSGSGWPYVDTVPGAISRLNSFANELLQYYQSIAGSFEPYIQWDLINLYILEPFASAQECSEGWLTLADIDYPLMGGKSGGVCTISHAPGPSMTGIIKTGPTSSQGSYSSVIDRDYELRNNGMKYVYHYDTEVGGKRVVAVDYDDEGTRLVVAQELTCDVARYTTTVQTNKVRLHKLKPYGHHSANLTEVIDTFSWDIDMEWALTINGEPLITAKGGSADGKYEREVIRRWGTVDGDTLLPELEYNVSGSDAFFTERVWVVDVDARTRSAIYSKARYDGEGEPLSVALGSDNLLLRAPMIDIGESSRTDELYFLHDGEEYSFEVPDRGGSLASRLYSEAAALRLIPRMFSANEEFENGIPQTMAVGEILVNRRWLTAPLECNPTFRSAGQIAVRGGDAIFSSSDINTKGIDAPPCAPGGRETNYFNLAVIRGEVYPLESAITEALADGEYETAPPDGDARYYPVRVV